jgi:hypothetical protein
MWSFFGKRIVTIAVLALVGLVAAEAARNRLALPQRPASDGVEGAAYESTGSVGVVLPLTDEQREHIYNGVMRHPDTARTDTRASGFAEELWSDKPLQDLPASVTGEIPLLRAHKFVKLDDRILVINPTARTVVAMIPRYRLLP